jgi:hypothetical protein
VGRREDVAVVQGLADTDRDRFLADRHVEETGQLACAEALLDLLLEPPDQEHFAQKRAQPIVAQRPFALNLRHGREFMLSLVALVDQWRAIEQSLPDGWGDARLRLTVAEEGQCDRAAALLGPATPGRHGRVLSFFTARRGSGPSPDFVERLLRRLDREGIQGTLELVGADAAVDTADEPPQQAPKSGSFVDQWKAELAALPEDWSDLYAEVELDSSDYLERAALLLAPLNPTRYGGKPGFRFRVAQRFGYGASPEMSHRCFERLDEEGIRGRVRVLHALSDTRPVQTQGPVWYVGGTTV